MHIHHRLGGYNDGPMHITNFHVVGSVRVAMVGEGGGHWEQGLAWMGVDLDQFLDSDKKHTDFNKLFFCLFLSSEIFQEVSVGAAQF